MVDEPGSDFLSVWLFLLGCNPVLATVITQDLKVRQSGMESGLSLGVATVYHLIFVRMAVPSERSHLVDYGMGPSSSTKRFLSGPARDDVCP